VSVIGGQIPHVGVAGVILGGLSSLQNASYRMLINIGGYFHFSGQYGLAADNAKNFEVRIGINDRITCWLTPVADCASRWNNYRCKCTAEQRLILGSEGRRTKFW